MGVQEVRRILPGWAKLLPCHNTLSRPGGHAGLLSNRMAAEHLAASSDFTDAFARTRA